MDGDTPSPRSLFSKLFRADDGPLTRELVRAPAKFGLGQLPEKALPDRTTTMVCGFCSTGCGLEIHLKDGKAVGLTPNAGYPVNLGMACPKGWEALTPLAADDRATTPLLRNAQGRLVPIEWPEALETFVTRMKAVQAEHGPHSVAVLGTGQICTEELAILGAFAKFGMGVLHTDGNTRQCMATSAAAYKQTYGFDAPPYTYADFEQSDVLVFVGANPCIAHPIMWERVVRNKNTPKIVVIDPRRTETAMAASLHVAPYPKTDLVLLYAVARGLIAKGAIDRAFVDAHTEGFDEFAVHVEPYSYATAAEHTGVPAATIKSLVETIAAGKRVSFWWTMGVNQSHEGVLTAQAIIALSLMTGNIGRPGTGANSITGQCNAMGSRLFSNTTNLLGGHDFTSEADREKVASVLEIDVDRIPSKNGNAYDQIVEGIHRGEIRGLWIVATNTSHSWINQNDTRALLSKLDFLVVQDMYHSTDTAAQAHLVLPAAGWGEKEGTFINSERRFGLVKRVARAPGKALADFHIVRLLAEAWGVGRMFEKWSSPEATFQLLKALSRGQPCDFTGIEGYSELDLLGGVQWPLPEGQMPSRGSERRLFADGKFYRPNGRAKFVFGSARPMPEPTTTQHPLILLTGRGSSAQWHTETRTGKSSVLVSLSPKTAYVEIHPDDAEARGIEPNAWVTIRSKRGKMRARAHVTRVVRQGQIFIPMHFVETNRLTFAAFDPTSRQPSYKACAVEVEAAIGPNA